MVKFDKEEIELIRNKIDSEELKTIGRLKKTIFTRERKSEYRSHLMMVSILSLIYQ